MDQLDDNKNELNRVLEIAFENPQLYKIPKGIIRFDHGTAHAWRVSIARDKARFIEYFFDGSSGSIENGLRRAILYRQEILDTFPITLSITNRKNIDPNPENRIKRCIDPGRVNPYVYWQAIWYDESHAVKTKNFSVNKFGETEAKKMALEIATKNHNSTPKKHLLHDHHSNESWRILLRSDVAKAAEFNDYTVKNKTTDIHPDAEDSNPFGYEGERLLKIHTEIERDKKIRNKKISEFLWQHGRVFCELCQFAFIDKYPFLSKNIIEVHHIIPLSKIHSSTVINSSDLLLLCPNCHTAIHQGDAETNLILMRKIFNKTC
jgi:predicted HNH restriction endonuclease